MSLEVLPYNAAVKYLGRMITFDNCHEAEVKNRLACAWKRFMTIRDELTNKKYSLNQRLRLFDMTVSASMLYGTAAWTLTKKLEGLIRRNQRKMLRMILHYPRRVIPCAHGEAELESWVDWEKRTTHAAEARLKSLNLREWVESHFSAKTSWDESLKTGKSDNWAHWAYHWTPDGKRKPGRPKQRWNDTF
jgi:hypothetical protein